MCWNRTVRDNFGKKSANQIKFFSDAKVRRTLGTRMVPSTTSVFLLTLDDSLNTALVYRRQGLATLEALFCLVFVMVESRNNGRTTVENRGEISFFPLKQRSH